MNTSGAHTIEQDQPFDADDMADKAEQWADMQRVHIQSTRRTLQPCASF
jgi:hypothetical protein